jgi:hypothetical protein
MGHLTAYCVAIASLLTGAAVVHNLYKPNLVLPLEKKPESEQGQEKTSTETSK